MKRGLLIILLLVVLSACQEEQESHDHDHEHNGSSETEAIIYRGKKISGQYQIEVVYTSSLGNIIDVNFQIYKDDKELIAESESGALNPDLTPPLYSQIERLEQYIKGNNQFPKLDEDGLAPQISGITIDIRPLKACFENASDN